MSRRTIVIVGGALSGPTAAARAREIDEEARIVLLERNRDVSYAVGGLAYHLSGEVGSLDELNREREKFFRDVYRIDVRTRATVKKIDAGRHRIQLKDKGMRYDALVYAAGAESVLPSVPQLKGAKNVVRFRTLQDLESIIKRLDAGAKHVTVIGGGFIGVEAADGFLRRGVKVTLIEQGPRLLPRFGTEISNRAARALRQAGASVYTDATIARAYRKGTEVSTIGLKNKKSLKTDLVIIAAGLVPRTGLLRDAGAKLLEDGTVKVTQRCATSLPDVFACGVCVSVPHCVTGKPVWFAQAAQADKMAQVAGACAAGGKASMGPVLGTAIVRAGALTVARTGLTETEARAHAEGRFRSIRVTAPSCDPFLAGSQDVSVVIYFDRQSGRVLGAEVAGEGGADKRVDVLAAAIAGGLTVEQLATLDLAYAPPYSAARDPVNVSGTVATATRRGLAAAWSPDEVSGAGDELTLVDVRGIGSFQDGSVAGAINIPLSTLRKQADALRPDRPAVFLSQTGREGYLAARIANQHGVKRAGYLAGGLDSWTAEGRRLVSAAGAGR